MNNREAKNSFSSALKWAYSANWGEKVFSSLFLFILAALLGPRDFGVVSLATIYIAFFQMLQTQGFQVALIQRRSLRDEHLDTVFWTNVFVAGCASVLSLAAAPLWARLNGVPELRTYIAALSLCIPLQGLTIVQTALLQR